MDNLPSSIKSGRGGGEPNNLEKEEIEVNVTSSIMTFMSYSIQSSSIYVDHSNRTIITPQDIKKAMMVEVFMFFERADLNIRVAEWRELILNEMQDESEEEYEDEPTEEETENIIHAEKKDMIECKCNICELMNNIQDRWKYYEPSDQLGKIFKKHIDAMDK